MIDDEPPTFDEPEALEVVTREGPPPLRIHHLMLATTVAAVLLSVNELLRRGDVLNIAQFFKSTHGAVYTIVTSLALTTVILGIWWRFQGRTFFNQPGHWLLVKQSLFVAIYIAVAIAAAMRLANPESTGTLAIGAYSIFVYLAFPVISVYAAWKIADSIAWRLFFVLYAFQSFVWIFAGFLGMRFISLMQWASVLFLVLLLAAALGDMSARRQRDWPHWLGVALQFVMLTFAIVQVLWTTFAAANGG